MRAHPTYSRENGLAAIGLILAVWPAVAFAEDEPQRAAVRIEVKNVQPLGHLRCEPCCFLPDDKKVAVVGSSATLIVVDLKTNDSCWNRFVGSQLAYAASRDGRIVATAEGREKDDPIRLWDLVNRKFLKELPGHDKTCALGFTPDASRLFSCGGDGTARCTDVDTGKLIWKSRQYHENGSQRPCLFRFLALSPNGKHVAVARGRDVKIFNTVNGETIKEMKLPHDPPPAQIAYGPDSKHLVATYQRVSEIVDTDTGQLMHTVLCGGHWPQVALSPDGKLFVIAMREKTTIYDWATKRELKVLNGAAPAVFSQDGKRLATASVPPPDTSLMLWDLEALEVIPKKK